MNMEELGKYVEVFISPDKMSADFFLSEDIEWEEITVDMICDYARDKGVVFGIEKELIEKALANRMSSEMITFAKGEPPQEGRDGYFDYKFDVEESKKAGKPKVFEDGSVNYRELNIVECVKVGDVVAEYHPKVDGIPGTNVIGEPVKAGVKRDMAPLRGKGFSKSEDGRFYRSEIDGRPAMKFGQLEISNVFEISGDVDLSTGNVNFRGDIIITGNITSGMTVKTTGTITVNGMIEAAEVSAGGSILVKGGILGGSKANIVSSGDVIALFIENATVKAGENVMTDCIVNGDVHAYKDVIVTKKTAKSGRAGSIIGGRVIANRLIKAHSIGAPGGMRTELRLGVPYKVHKEYMGFKIALENAQAELAKIENAISMMEVKRSTDIDMRTKLIKAKIDKASYVYKYKEICEKTEKNINMGKGACVMVINKLYPGVVLKIDEVAIVTTDEYNTIVLKRKGERIVSQKYVPSMDTEE